MRRQTSIPALLLSLSIAGCGGSEPPPAAPTAVTPPAPEPVEPAAPAEAAESKQPPVEEPAPEPAPTYDHGRFVWFEHWSKDAASLDKAKAFYSELFGWSVVQQQMGDASYWEIQHDSVPIGLLSTPPHSDALKGGATWMGYVSVPDVDASVTAATAAGGSLIGEAAEIPDLGKFAHLKAPSGAFIGVFTGAKGDLPEAQPEPGKFAWMEVWVKNDKAKAPEVAFLSAACGWTTADMPMGKTTYTTFMTAEKGRGGLSAAKKARDAGAWIPFVMVADVDGAAKKAKKAKAKLVMAPTTLDKVGRIAVLADPTGAKFGLWSPPPEASPEITKPASE